MNKMGEMYAKHHNLFGYHGRDATEEMRAFLAKYGLNEHITFLEAGGSGCRASAMSKLGAKTYYIDVSDEQIKLRQNDNLTGICGSICDPQPIKDCDLIFCLGVIHHTENPAQALMNMAKWLKVGGVLYLFFYSAEYEYFFWIDLMRKLLPKNVTYDDLYAIVPYANIEHLFVPTINYGTYDIVKHDLDVLGFEIIHEERDRTENFIVKKNKEVDVDINSLLYKPGIPISLPDDVRLKIVLDIFNSKYVYKKRNPIKMALFKLNRFLRQSNKTVF